MHLIRLAKIQDAPVIRDIYAPHIEYSTTSFEMEVPSIEEMQYRINQYLTKGPWLVMENQAEIVGYAYASEHRGRAAYQWSIELSVYVKENFQKKGIASKLYRCALDILKAQGYSTILAGITQPNNPSNAFHESMGFKFIGTYHNIGYKHGAWRDVKWYELFLTDNQSNPKPIIRLDTLKESGQLQQIFDTHNL